MADRTLQSRNEGQLKFVLCARRDVNQFGKVNWPEAEFDVSVGVVRSLVRDQFPDLGNRAIEHVADGTDNALWRLGDQLVVRLPRRLAGDPLLGNEVRWIPELAQRPPLLTPAPLRVGAASGGYPKQWVISQWFDGGRSTLHL